MKPLNLMIDIDEVLFPLGDSIHEIGHEVGLHDNSTPWSQWEAWHQYGCDEGSYWELWKIFADRDGYTTTPPIPGQVEALRHLYFEGHRINLVTARGFFDNGDEVKAWTRQWIENFAVPLHSLTFTQDKVATQQGLGAFDLAVDDSPKHYSALEADDVNVWLQDHPHNRDFQASCRISNLWQFAATVKKVADQ